MKTSIVAALAFATLIGGTSMSLSDATVETRNKAIVAAAFDAWRSGTGSPFDLLEDDATWTIVGHLQGGQEVPEPGRLHDGGYRAVQRAHEDGDQA